MKVYLDQQIWALLENGSFDVEIINRAARLGDCKYYLSVAHLEELHNAEIKESEDKQGITKRLELFMKKYCIPGIIKETLKGVKFHEGEKEYQIARKSVWGDNTAHTVQVMSDMGLYAQKNNLIDPKNLFTGRRHEQDTEYKDIWKIPKIINILNVYGIENAKYQDMKDYLELLSTMTLAFTALTAAGYKRDKNRRLHNSGAYDIQHAIRATYCDVFVTQDENFRKKYKAVAYYLQIPIEILSFKEFEEKYS